MLQHVPSNQAVPVYDRDGFAMSVCNCDHCLEGIETQRKHLDGRTFRVYFRFEDTNEFWVIDDE